MGMAWLTVHVPSRKKGAKSKQVTVRESGPRLTLRRRCSGSPHSVIGVQESPARVAAAG